MLPGPAIARFGAAISSLTKCLWLAALYSLMSTRAGALPKIYRQTTKRGELCVVTACNERIACSKACYFLLPSADTRCELLKVVPRMKPQDHVPSSTFHGPIKQQKYGHRQSLDGDSGFFHCITACTPAGGRHQLHFLPNERETFSQHNLDLITSEGGFTKVQFRKSTNDRAKP